SGTVGICGDGMEEEYSPKRGMRTTMKNFRWWGKE
ncbi:hypothetical protein A2U01_0076598, partial [Trifolium medium]|nr:hypothetical protein [Trifolium medium]